MSEQSFFGKKRICASCNAERKEKDVTPGGPRIIGISFTIYRRGQGKKQLAGAGRVQICEECFVRAMASGGLFEGAEARRFLAAVRARLTARYTLMLEEDATPQEQQKPDGPDLFAGVA
jgi:hypothetical protein